jgi:hypothetical protein
VTARAATAAAPNDPAAAQSYIAAVLAEQQRLTIPPERRAVLTRDKANIIASQIANADPAKIDIGKDMMAPMARLYGDQWPKVMGDLARAGLPRDAQIIATMVPEEGQPDTQAVARADYQDMLRIQSEKGGHEALKKVAGENKVKEITTNLSSTLQDFQRTTADPTLALNVRDGIENLAHYYAFRGEDGSTALAHAYKNVIGNKYDFNGILRVPKGQGGVIERAGDALVKGLRPEDMQPDMPGAIGLPPEYNREVMLAAIRRGYWMTNESDDGAVLYVKGRNGRDTPARLADGNRVELKFRDAAGLAEDMSPGANNPVPAASYIPSPGTQ